MVTGEADLTAPTTTLLARPQPCYRLEKAPRESALVCMLQWQGRAIYSVDRLKGMFCERMETIPARTRNRMRL